jgi:hypothetical protein
VKREEQVFVEYCGFVSVLVEVVAACDQSEVVVAARGSIFRSGSDLAGVALFSLFSFCFLLGRCLLPGGEEKRVLKLLQQ